MAVLVATTSKIITGYIDTYFDVEPESDDGLFADMLEEGETFEGFEPLVHDEPDYKQRLKALLMRLRRVSKAKWLLVHDADDAECWLEQGFRVLDPPADVPPNEALLMLAWGR